MIFLGQKVPISKDSSVGWLCVYLFGSKSEAKAYTFTIQFSSQDEVIVKVFNYYRVTKLFLENHQKFAKNF